MKSAWMITGCDKCNGSGWDFCQKCEGHCDHDTLCAACRGAGYVPLRLDGFGVIAARMSRTTELFSTKAAALKEIEHCYS